MSRQPIDPTRCERCVMIGGLHAPMCPNHPFPPKERSTMTDVDMVNHPPHYRHPSGVQCIEVTRQCHGDLSAAIQYIWRYDAKGTPEQDLAKARWYLNDILTNGLASHPPNKAKALLMVVVDAEPNLLKARLLQFITGGRLADAIDTINALVWED